MLVQEFAKHYPELTFVHAYPGPVRSGLASKAETGWIRTLAPVLNALTYPISASAESSGEYLLAGLLRSGKGSWRIGAKGEDLGKSKYSEEVRQKVWEHSLKETDVA